MFALQRNGSKFFCYTNSSTGKGGFRRIEECSNIFLEKYPSKQNRRRDRLLKIYTKSKIKVVRLTPKQLEYFLFVKLRGRIDKK